MMIKSDQILRDIIFVQAYTNNFSAELTERLFTKILEINNLWEATL